MLLSVELLQKTKRTNVSADPAKTRRRVEEILRPARLAQKKAVRELAGVTTQVFHTIYSKGNISIRMVIAISQVLDVSPFYLTGEADEPGAFSEEALRDLLLKHKYRDLVASLELPEKKKRLAKAEEPTQQPAADEAPPAEAEDSPLPAEPQLPPGSGAIDEADLHLLLSAASIQAKAGIPSAKERMDQIKRLLLA
jgi:transcriptional regulator with XRE-family HTH domain